MTLKIESNKSISKLYDRYKVPKTAMPTEILHDAGVYRLILRMNIKILSSQKRHDY